MVDQVVNSSFSSDFGFQLLDTAAGSDFSASLSSAQNQSVAQISPDGLPAATLQPTATFANELEALQQGPGYLKSPTQAGFLLRDNDSGKVHLYVRDLADFGFDPASASPELSLQEAFGNAEANVLSAAQGASERGLIGNSIEPYQILFSIPVEPAPQPQPEIPSVGV